MNDRLAVDVALPLPVRHSFSYLVPEELRQKIEIGQRVRVPFGPRHLVGFVVQKKLVEPTIALKEVERLVDLRPLVSQSLVDLSHEIAVHWICGPGETLAAFVPIGVKKGSLGKKTVLVAAVRPEAEKAVASWPHASRLAKQLDILKYLLAEKAPVARRTVVQTLKCSESPIDTLIKRGLIAMETTTEVDDPFARLEMRKLPEPQLTSEQSSAVDRIGKAIEQRAPGHFLLQGVTGSGKTEVYLGAIRRALDCGRGAIVMVPEIALTPQTIERFGSRFGEVAVLHSHMTDAARAAQWREIYEGKKKIAIGPRSAVFAPVVDLGLIILDEEHDGAFKQQNTPRYHAREVAMMRARNENAVVCLGSATPSLETLHQASIGRIERLLLSKRVGPHALPAVTLVDMRSEKGVGPGGLFSPLLTNFVHRHLERDEAVLLFLNRRGYSTAAMCKRCGKKVECSNCSIPLVFYKGQRKLLCHYCGQTAEPPNFCPECRAAGMHYTGYGTETVEHAAKTLFPTARIARMDGETMRGKSAYDDIYQRLKAGEIDILIGTQMVAKGLDLPRITLIGVISADTSLLIPDFRSPERTFQLITQVAGRAGRGAKAGRVLVQTYMPDHYSLKCAAAHDIDGFAKIELDYRRESRYPPYGSLLRIVAQGEDEARVGKRCEEIVAAIGPLAEEAGMDVLGPAPCPIAMLQKRYRHHIVVRADLGKSLERLATAAADKLRSDKHVQILLDRDPIAMM